MIRLFVCFLLLGLHAGAADEIISIWPEDAPGIKTDIQEQTKSPNDRYFNMGG